MSELKRCPFCSCELMPNTNQDDLYVKRYGTHWNHPDGPCFLDGTEVSPSQVDAWNQRVATQGADTRPVAIYQILDDDEDSDVSWIDVAKDYFDQQLPDRRRIVYAARDAAPSGWKLAMRVLQSDLYATLDDAERAECDALIRTNPYIAAIAPREKT